jgi:2-oxo-3-hexenedioate decarboxylase
VTDPGAMAAALIRAERERTPLRPFTRSQPFLDVRTAYAVQDLVVGHRLSSGERVVGAKLGLTSKVKRDALGIQDPVYGRLTSGMIQPFGRPLRIEEFISPRAEPEIAFLIGRSLEPPLSIADVLSATEAVLPALEIMDSRYAERFRLPDSVADNAGAARVVLGTTARSPWDLEDLRVLGCVFGDGDREYTAAGGTVMGHPAAAVLWLVERLGERGQALEAGSLVLSGGLTTAVPLRPGLTLTVEFDGLGSIEAHCI